MYAPLSSDEREALSHFVSKLVEDVDKLASLFESRGLESTLPRTAHDHLRRTLEVLRTARDYDTSGQGGFQPQSEIGYNRLS